MRVVRQGRAKFTVNGAGIDWRDMLKHADQYHHGFIGDDTAYRESMRVCEIEEMLAAQANSKPRRPAVSRGNRKYPADGASQSTHEYVLAYFAMNKDSGMDARGFEALSKHITAVLGRYTEVHRS